MNKKQKIVVWIGIILISLILILPRYHDTDGWHTAEGEPLGGWENTITRTRLCIIVGLVSAGLIVTFKGKDTETPSPIFQWLKEVWDRSFTSSPDKAKNKNNDQGDKK